MTYSSTGILDLMTYSPGGRVIRGNTNHEDRGVIITTLLVAVSWVIFCKSLIKIRHQ